MFQGGLRIYTTLQRPKQAMAANAVQGQMDQFRGDPAGALASVEPSTGRIVALYGGRSFKKSQVDLATAQGGTGFQPGSAFKMFFVVAALEKGISPGSSCPARPRSPSPTAAATPATTSPGPRERRRLQRRDLQHVRGRGQLGEHLVRPARGGVGPERAVEVARRMGITNIPPRNSKAYGSWNVCSLVLGAREVSVLDMAGAFGVLANKGVRCPPYSITKVVAPGERKPLIENKPDCKQVISEAISTRTVAMLRGVITGGTGGNAALAGGRPVAGKTGSAQNNTSAFFSGFTPQLSTSVWWATGPGGCRCATCTTAARSTGDLPGDHLQELHGRGPGWPARRPVPGRRRRRPPPEVGVPGVVGLPKETAEAVLAQAGFGSSVKPVRSAQPKGRVVRQAPGPGARLRQGSTVVLAVSAGRGGGNNVIVRGGRARAGMARTVLAQAGRARPRLHQQGAAGPGRRPEPGRRCPAAQRLLRHPGREPAELAAEALQHQAADLVAVGAALDLGHEAALTLPSSLGPLAPEAATASSTSRASSAGSRAAGRNRSSTDRS